MGNLLTDSHSITGSLRITGSLAIGSGSYTQALAVKISGSAYNGANVWFQDGSSTDGMSFGGNGVNSYKTINTYGGALYLNNISQNGVNLFGNVGINTSRTNGTNSTALILQDNATGVQTPGYGLRLQYQSNGTGIISAIGMEAGGSGTNNESQISFYTQNTAGALGQRLLISSTGAACFACELTAKTLGTNDLLLNNLNYECANYVDGTRGSWLIQEGACDLFIINQISCKKYKFNLIEIK
jgi:hypothetical protein